MPPAKKKLLLLDFDGTLVDSMGSFADLAASLIQEQLGLSFAEGRAAYLKTSGLPFFRQLEVLFPEKELQGLAKQFEREKIKSYAQSPVYPEALETLKEIKKQGIKLAVSSNNSQEVLEDYLTQQKNLAGLLDLTFGWKPDFAKGASHFLAALEHFHLESNEALFMGDSLHDGLEAQNFGLDFVARLGTFKKEDFEDQPYEVLAYDYQGVKELLCKSSY